MMSAPPESSRRHGLGRHLPLLLILGVAVLGWFTLGDWLSFETLRQNRAALLAFRDDNALGLGALVVAG